MGAKEEKERRRGRCSKQRVTSTRSKEIDIVHKAAFKRKESLVIIGELSRVDNVHTKPFNGATN
jgi:hypothetical protein